MCDFCRPGAPVACAALSPPLPRPQIFNRKGDLLYFKAPATPLGAAHAGAAGAQAAARGYGSPVLAAGVTTRTAPSPTHTRRRKFAPKRLRRRPR